ncbi:hypothetical protein AXF42_Ash013186 [Apostasia shenzhenica]|uniref:Uncharacterized protein n=1 Tax=Apostasia shenzhenica TaxID=1088818 RepID=A0A2I0BD92_9ASPA|nr:hypothetical protein AXF42_Ash013186 [Apostasia shenzhenica]
MIILSKSILGGVRLLSQMGIGVGGEQFSDKLWGSWHRTKMDDSKARFLCIASSWCQSDVGWGLGGIRLCE